MFLTAARSRWSNETHTAMSFRPGHFLKNSWRCGHRTLRSRLAIKFLGRGRGSRRVSKSPVSEALMHCVSGAGSSYIRGERVFGKGELKAQHMHGQLSVRPLRAHEKPEFGRETGGVLVDMSKGSKDRIYGSFALLGLSKGKGFIPVLGSGQEACPEKDLKRYFPPGCGSGEGLAYPEVEGQLGKDVYDRHICTQKREMTFSALPSIAVKGGWSLELHQGPCATRALQPSLRVPGRRAKIDVLRGLWHSHKGFPRALPLFSEFTVKWVSSRLLAGQSGTLNRAQEGPRRESKRIVIGPLSRAKYGDEKEKAGKCFLSNKGPRGAPKRRRGPRRGAGGCFWSLDPPTLARNTVLGTTFSLPCTFWSIFCIPNVLTFTCNLQQIPFGGISRFFRPGELIWSAILLHSISSFSRNPSLLLSPSPSPSPVFVDYACGVILHYFINTFGVNHINTLILLMPSALIPLLLDLLINAFGINTTTSIILFILFILPLSFNCLRHYHNFFISFNSFINVFDINPIILIIPLFILINVFDINTITYLLFLEVLRGLCSSSGSPGGGLNSRSSESYG
eukprot:284816529_6